MIGFYAGSFDPFTNGHLQIVKKSSKWFEKVIVGIGQNLDKKSRISKDKMKIAIEETMVKEGICNVEVIVYDCLTTEAAKSCGADVLIRGLRNGTDYQYEESIAAINEINAGIDTWYLRAGTLGYLSSSIVMDLFYHGKDVSNYVPEPINKILLEGK